MNRAQSQSNDEWLAEYDSVTTFSGREVGMPSGGQPKPENLGSGLYSYSGYKTRPGRLVLDLTDIETGEVLPAFFNVNTTYQRGPMSGQNFKTGSKGRFWLYPKSKFALLWLDTFGQTDKWSRIYRQMNRLNEIQFTGRVQSAATYHQVVDLKRCRND